MLVTLDLLVGATSCAPVKILECAGSGMVATDESHDSEVNGENMDCCS